jgi:TetR/AcrR family transcriptional regulator
VAAPVPSVPARDRILDAAEALFAERGFAGTSVRDLAARVGVTPGSLYNHFPGKEALYEAVLARGVRPLIGLMQELAARPQTPDATAEILGAVMAHLAERPHLPRLIQQEAVAGGEHLTALARAWIRPLVEYGLAEIARQPDSPWAPAERPLVIAAWLHLILGHFALAPLLREVLEEDPLSPRVLALQTAFLRKLAHQMMSAAPRGAE